MALRLAQKAAAKKLTDPTVALYRSMTKELPKVLSIYDIDLPLPKARALIRSHFSANAHVKDPRVKDILIAKGYMELEETLMQWKQKAQLMRVFEAVENKHHRQGAVEPGLRENVNAMQQFETRRNEKMGIKKTKKRGVRVL